MANKTYFIQFGIGNPASFTGLSPTFLVFNTTAGATTAPGITEVPTTTGIYYFNYNLGGASNPITFVADGATTGLNANQRYVSGALDPVQAIDQQIGTSANSYGSTSVDPTTLFGYMKRNLEFEEGNSTFNKTSGLWDIYSRGSSTLLIEKTLVDSGGIITKT